MRCALPYFLLTGGLICSIYAGAQEKVDSSGSSMEEVIIKAFEQNRKLRNVPAAVNYIGPSTLSRFSHSSIVQAVNTTAGVRMEERSPGSYRFNIRGSSLRSPFGVRNVKVYFNDIPITDPGGQTYLNQLGYYNFQSLEIIKGPGSSLYGAGTGGVLLIESLPSNPDHGVFSEYATGCYGLQNAYISVSTGNLENTSQVGFQHQQSNGYRAQSALRRDVLSWSGQFHLNTRGTLKTTFLYGDLFYQTPGALTRAEYEKDPAEARPGGGGFPGSVQAQASIRQRTLIAGASYEQPLSTEWSNRSVLYGMFTDLRNPTIRNYGKSMEPHTGGRTSFQWRHPLSKGWVNWLTGAEIQRGFSSVNIHKNRLGTIDTLQTLDEINNRQLFTFTQLTIDWNNWELTGGASWNLLKVNFQRFTPAPLGYQTRNFNNQLAPRMALMRKLKNVSVYSSFSRGFSPPTTSELLPTGGSINLSLNPETGNNLDLGIKGSFPSGLTFDVNVFLFNLTNTIVQRRDAGGGDYFSNAGKTRQRGVETMISYPLLQGSAFIDRSTLWFSHTYHHFNYRDFKQLTADYSGNFLTGVAPHTVSTGYDFQALNGLLGTISYYYSSRIPLNDANSEYGQEYHLVGLKLGYQQWIKNWRFKLMAGMENLLDQQYSLGFDINGFGGRYYNAAPGRNYFAALVIQWKNKKPGT